MLIQHLIERRGSIEGGLYHRSLPVEAPPLSESDMSASGQIGGLLPPVFRRHQDSQWKMLQRIRNSAMMRCREMFPDRGAGDNRPGVPDCWNLDKENCRFQESEMPHGPLEGARANVEDASSPGPDDELRQSSQRWIIQLDNCPAHKARATLEYFASLGSGELLFQPRCSPVHQPLENIFNLLKGEVKKASAVHPNVHQGLPLNLQDSMSMLMEAIYCLSKENLEGVIDHYVHNLTKAFDKEGMEGEENHSRRFR